MHPFFSIVIPTLNEEINLPILLSSLEKQTFRDFEVIVVDSLSKDKTKEKAFNFKDKFSHFIFLETEKCKTVGSARNYGADQGKGKYLVFLDADIKFMPDFLSGVKKHLEKDKVDFLSLWNRSENKKWGGVVIFAILNAAMMLLSKIKPAVNGVCMIVEKNKFKKIGGFDKEIVFGEDSEFVQRLHASGGKVGIYRIPIIYVSTRRFEKEGFLKSIFKSLSAVIYQNIYGPIKRPIFEYEMGGQYYQKNIKTLKQRTKEM